MLEGIEQNKKNMGIHTCTLDSIWGIKLNRPEICYECETNAAPNIQSNNDVKTKILRHANYISFLFFSVKFRRYCCNYTILNIIIISHYNSCCGRENNNIQSGNKRKQKEK